ncbi:MAG TPA: hypothetical protein PLZ27_04010 [Bacillota bacterium]|nr:hypothetical protein [Clostridiales bacterium]HPU17818.1 hypothetical protein [Bacillota bacterium]
MSFLAYLTALAAAVAVHEAGHITAALAFGVEMRRIRIFPAGFMIDCEIGSVPYSKSAVILLAGAAANLLAAAITALFCGVKAQFFTVNIGLAFFNLLPMYGLDGGGVLFCLLSMFLCGAEADARAARITRVVCGVVLFLFWLAAVYINIKSGGSLPMLFAAVYLIARYAAEDMKKI